MEKTPFFKKTWFIILLFWIVPPIGIALMWTCKKEWKKAIRIVLSVIFGIWFFLWCVLLLSPTDSTPADSTPSAEDSTTIYDENNNEIYEETTARLPSYITDETTSEIQEETTAKPTTTQKETTTSKPTTTRPTTTKAPTTADPDSRVTVYRTKTGEKYHYENPCGNGTYYAISLADAKRAGLDPCGKCVLH